MLAAAAIGLVGGLSFPAGQTAAQLPIQLDQSATEEPVVISADDLVFDEALGTVIASGDVEISQGDRILRADRVTYNQRTDIVTATGNIVLVEPSGEVIFAEYAELQGDLADGFVRDISVLFTDDSRMTANAGLRRAGRVTEGERAVYSPCSLCPDDPDAPPLWQLRAARIYHDTETRDIEYQDVAMEIFGVPIAYSPYLSHPDPTVERRTGFLTPSFGYTEDLGAFFIAPYYIDISPEQDATVQLGYTTEAGPILQGEYRRRFGNGFFNIEGSVNQGERLVDEGTADEGVRDRIRGHFFGETRFDLTEHWRVGGEWQLVSDDTYLETFDISSEDVLQSRAYVEGFYGLSYYAVEAYGFDDLRSGDRPQGDIVPVLTASHVSEPGSLLGGQWSINANALNLIENPEQTRRFTVAGNWQREIYSDAGLVTDVSAQLRGDLYWVDELENAEDPSIEPDDSVSTRLYPYVHLTSRYPLVRQTGRLQQLVEPVVSFTAATSFDDTEEIPNNDSLVVEFDEINLLEVSRFPGFDLVEEGARVTYGLRTGLYHTEAGSGTIFLGQSFRFAGENSFETGSGLEDDLSDIVGQVSLQPREYLNLDWRFRLDDSDFTARRSELRASAGIPEFRLSTTYTFLDGIATEDGEDREEILIGARSRLSDLWSAATSFRRDIAEQENRSISGNLTYNDECILVRLSVSQDLTEDRDRSGGLSVLLTIGFRNLGDPITFGTGTLDDLAGSG